MSPADPHVLARVVAAGQIREAIRVFDEHDISLSSVQRLEAQLFEIAEFLAPVGLHADLTAGRAEAIRFEKETRGDAMVAATVGLRVVRSPDAGENAANVALAAADAWDEKRASR